ncbi:hypothetical protein [Pandoraea terrigena]|uniref:Phage tail protein n=1 Tax=Pandoraea terrigena TaxID=2508292 RepID=A0A5E4YLZ6_9BURK|nr:hypothetical protein [Pandoraea terrigena]VVE49425.1 hypothetical protein PTE31013_04632 [Pandoraea terrigena]
MQILSKEAKSAILGALHLKTELVDVPEWGDGVAVLVSEMSGTARDAFYSAREGVPKQSISESQAKLLLATVVDESGAPVFDEGDIEGLRAQSSVALDRIAGVAMRLNGMGPAAVEEAAKNSAAGQKSDSGTGSASTSESPSAS